VPSSTVERLRTLLQKRLSPTLTTRRPPNLRPAALQSQAPLRDQCAIRPPRSRFASSSSAAGCGYSRGRQDHGRIAWPESGPRGMPELGYVPRLRVPFRETQHRGIFPRCLSSLEVALQMRSTNCNGQIRLGRTGRATVFRLDRSQFIFVAGRRVSLVQALGCLPRRERVTLLRDGGIDRHHTS
jgi:hypothetical protein